MISFLLTDLYNLPQRLIAQWIVKETTATTKVMYRESKVDFCCFFYKIVLVDPSNEHYHKSLTTVNGKLISKWIFKKSVIFKEIDSWQTHPITIDSSSTKTLHSL